MTAHKQSLMTYSGNHRNVIPQCHTIKSDIRPIGQRKRADFVALFCVFGVPQEIRTPDLRFRRPTLYPAELGELIHTCSLYHFAEYDTSMTLSCELVASSIVFAHFALYLAPTTGQSTVSVDQRSIQLSYGNMHTLYQCTQQEVNVLFYFI